MKYVKLTAKPDTWFKAGTEVYDYDSSPGHLTRVTVPEWERALKETGICVCGIRVCEDNDNENGMGCKPGEERWDGEWCHVDEFTAEIAEESR